jgi:hypothetical protein
MATMPHRLRSLIVFIAALGIISAAVAWQAAPTDDAKELIPVLRTPGPKFWKGNLHTHSFWSDGDDFPEMIADWYVRHGYQFLGMSDHNILAEGDRWIDMHAGKAGRAEALRKYRARFGDAWVERRDKDGKEQVRLKPLAEYRSLLEQPGKFLMIPAEEITHRFGLKPVHVNAINLRDLVTPAGGDNVGETIRVNVRAVEEQRKKVGRPMLAFLNHPNFGWGVRAEDMLVEELRYFEVYNGHSSVRNYGDAVHPSTEKLWDITLALRLGKLKMQVLYGLGTDDSHAYHVYGLGKTNPGRGWIMVRAPFLSAEAIVKSIEAGEFYVSSGVTLDDVRQENGALRLKINGRPGVTYKTQFIATLRGTPLDSEARTDDAGKTLDVTRVYHPDVGKVVAETDVLEPTYQFAGQELYVRARVTSSQPHPNPYEKGDVEMAWTQPMLP